MMYMGWGVEDEDIQWMNEVLAEYPDRIAFLNFHDYMLANGTRSGIGNKLYKEVVVPNPNVVAVLSGHYTGASLLKMNWMIMVTGMWTEPSIRCWQTIKVMPMAAVVT